MKDNIRMQRVWNYDKNTPSSQSTSPGYINIPMHKLNGDSTRNSVINDIDEDDSSVVWEINSPSSNLEYKGVDHDLDEEAANEFTKLTVRSSKITNHNLDKADLHKDDDFFKQPKRPSKSSIKLKDRPTKNQRVEFKRSQSQASPSKEVVSINDKHDTPPKQKATLFQYTNTKQGKKAEKKGCRRESSPGTNLMSIKLNKADILNTENNSSAAMQGATSVPLLTVDTVVSVDGNESPTVTKGDKGTLTAGQCLRKLHRSGGDDEGDGSNKGITFQKPPYFRTASRRSLQLIRGPSRLVMGSTKMDTYVEPEIEEVPGPMDEDDIMMDDHIGCDHEEVSLTGKIQAASIESMVEENEEFEGNTMLQGATSSFREEEDAISENEPRRRRSGKHASIFHTRHKLERGTMSAFRREARNIIERDLPHISHRDNIIRVWKDRSRDAHTFLAKTKPFVLFRHMPSFEFKYYFQHPYIRLLVSYIVIFCNFLVFAEDPVSHSKMEADIPVVGNVFSFVGTKYPPDWRWQLLKVTMWLLAVGCGMVVGKTIIHGMLLSRFLRLKMFRADQGSWMVQFFTVIVSLYLFSHAYNVLLVLTWTKNGPNGGAQPYTINSKMGITNSNLMKAAACGTWTGDLVSAMIITDMMLQDNLYPSWAPGLRKLWKRNNALRIGVFWIGSLLTLGLVIMIIATDWITWDRLNRDFLASTELSRGFLCSFVLVCDLTILMQDWDFPHFTNTLDVNLPGFYKHMVTFQAVEIQISGKWFNYGLIFLVLILDLNMWKNQIFYHPTNYGQYTAIHNRVFTVTNQTILQSGRPEFWSLDARSQINPATNITYMDEDLYMHSRFMNYSMGIKSAAFIPSIVCFLVFFTLILVYGRITPERSNSVPGQNSGAVTDDDIEEPIGSTMKELDGNEEKQKQ